MDVSPQTSFIPKKPLVASVGRNPQRFNLLSIVGGVAFIASLGLAGVVFGYKYYLNNSLTQAQTTLKQDVAAFDPDQIAEWTSLDSQLKSADALLQGHAAISNFFSYLGAETLQNVQFSGFSYSYSPDNQTATVNLSGKAPSFAAMALQEDESAKPENQVYFQNPVFSNLNLDKSGNVSFALAGTVNLSKFSYWASFNHGSGTTSQAVATSTASSTGSSTASTTSQ